ncbi:hypothetical protein tpqmel_0603 [Candidatus Gastranaerophilus sp. (ex Termes propinquus)]|nr:hypothetical protein tpqmel_0603 [Candidatus Gastranaerophilus sp. (ex Termes propinquus)]
MTENNTKYPEASPARNIIAFWGYPEPGILEKHKALYPQAHWVDLDVDFGHPESKVVAAIVPEAYCKIMKNIFTNAFHLKSRIIKILAPIGKDKCDSAFFAAQILKEHGFEVQATKFEQGERGQTPICTSNLPLRQKFETIAASIVNKKFPKTEQCQPRFGFWGVPPNDLTILELFPNNTHAYGWIRCVEAGVPADLELEMYADENVPTVFFAQTFCAKNQLAKYLANKYNGLYLDIDGHANNSVKAKLEAFLRLR